MICYSRNGVKCEYVRREEEESKSEVEMSQGCARSCVLRWILGPEVVQTLAGYTPVASLCGAGYNDVSMRCGI